VSTIFNGSLADMAISLPTRFDANDSPMIKTIFPIIDAVEFAAGFTRPEEIIKVLKVRQY
jgi:hypothetical protein